MLERELVQPFEGHAAFCMGVRVEVVVGEVGPGFSRSERGFGEFGHARVGECLLHLGFGAECPHLVAQDQVVRHARCRRDPHAFVVLGTRGLVVEMHGTVVASVHQRVDHPEGASDIADAEAEILVVARTVLAVEVDVEQLVLPQRLGVPVCGVEPGHLLVTDLGVDSEHLGAIEGVDERECMTDGGEEDVAARLVRLRFDGEPQIVAAFVNVLAEHVASLAIPGEGGAYILRPARFGALASAPAHVHLCAELGSEVDVAHDFANREAAYGAVVRGEAAVLEHWMAEQIRRRRGDHQPRVGEALLPLGHDALTFRLVDTERDDVVVVEVDAVRADLREFVQPAYRVEVRSGRLTERVSAAVRNGPKTERELVFGCRLRCGHALPLSSQDQSAVRSRSRAYDSRTSGNVSSGSAIDVMGTGHAGGSSVPASAHAACRAAPIATYSASAGTTTGTPKTPGASARTALLRAPPPTRMARRGVAPVAVTSASMPSASVQSRPSTDARAISARVVRLVSPCIVPVASGRLGVRSPSRYGRKVTPPAPGSADRARSASSSWSTPSVRAARSRIRAALSVQARGRNRPVASAKPLTIPVPSATGSSTTADATPDVPIEPTTSAGCVSSASAAAVLSPVPGAIAVPRCSPTTSAGSGIRGKRKSRPSARSARSGNQRLPRGE